MVNNAYIVTVSRVRYQAVTGSPLSSVLTNLTTSDFAMPNTTGFAFAGTDPGYAETMTTWPFLSTWPISNRMLEDMKIQNLVTSDGSTYSLASGQTQSTILAYYGSKVVTVNGMTDLTNGAVLHDVNLNSESSD